MRAPALVCAVPLITGIAAAFVFFDILDGLDARFPLICAGAALVALVSAAAAWLLDQREEAAAAVTLGCLAAGLSLGADAARRAYAPPLLRWFERALPQEPVTIEGVLREDAVVTPGGVSITVDLRSVWHPGAGGARGGVRLSVGGVLSGRAVDGWRAGRTIRAPAFLRRPSVYFDPGVPDERRALARRGIFLVGSVKSAALVEVVGRGGIVAESAAALRAATRRRIRRVMGRDPASAGVTTAVLIGDRSGLAAEDERRLQEAGTYHVIAISGGNVAILAVLMLVAGRALLIPARHAAVITAAALLFYGIVAAGAASVARAVTVAVVVLAGRAVDQRGPPLNALAVAAVCAAAAEPAVVLDAGFVLSFGATSGILSGVPLLLAWRDATPAGPVRRALRRISLALVALGASTLCAEVALAPVSASLFGQVPFAGFLLNFAAIPLMAIVQVAGLTVAAIASWSDRVAEAAGWAAHLAAAGLLRSSRIVEVFPWLAAAVAPPAWWLIAAYYTCALGALWRRFRRAAAVAWVGLAAIMLAGPPAATRYRVPRGPQPLRVVVFDVGQADATAVILPGHRALLVDAGGLPSFSADPEAEAARFDVGERVVAPALRALGVRHLDALVATHGDPDHLQGARGVLRRVRAASVWEGVPVPRHAGLQALAALARGQAMAWRTVQPGDAERYGDVEIRVLHPPLPDWERQRVRNDDSVVLEIRTGLVSIVLPGDIGEEGERAILPRLEPGRLVVLKAPHHGSATSSTQALLDRLRPAAVVFSCGRDNRFGHPHPAVVTRYQAIGAQIFSTAADGAVFVDASAESVDVWGWRGRRVRLNAQR